MELSVYGAYTNGTDIWLPCENMNALFCQKLTELKGAKYVCSFEGGKIPNAWKIGNVIYFEDSLFFFSLYSYEVWILDLQSQEMRRVSYYLDQGRFILDIIRVGNEAWIMPRSFDEPIIIFDLLTWQSERVDWGEKGDASDERSFTFSCTDSGQVFWATRTCGNIHVFEMNHKDKKIKCKKVPDIKFINCLVAYKGKLYALVLDAKGKALLKQYDLFGMSEEYSVELKGIDALWKDAYIFYFKMLFYKDNIIILPSLADNIVIYNMDKQEEISVSLPEEFAYRQRNKNELYFRKADLLDDRLYLYPSYGKHLLILNLTCREFEIREIFCQEEEFWGEYTKKIHGVEGILGETVHVSIVDYLCYVKDKAEGDKIEFESKLGKNIYDAVCEIKSK